MVVIVDNEVFAFRIINKNNLYVYNYILNRSLLNLTGRRKCVYILNCWLLKTRLMNDAG